MTCQLLIYLLDDKDLGLPGDNHLWCANSEDSKGLFTPNIRVVDKCQY